LDRTSEEQDRQCVEADKFWSISSLLQTLSTNFPGITDVTKSTCNFSKKESEFAAEILPMAQQLLENANRAGLTRSSNTEKGTVTAFEGQNYSVRCRENGDEQEFKVLCHRTSGLIYAVNGEPQKSQGLLKSDKTTFARYASMSPIQLNQAVRVKQTAVKAGLEL